jgi:hypothetical protein
MTSSPNRLKEISVLGDIAELCFERGEVALIDADLLPLVEGRNWLILYRNGGRAYASSYHEGASTELQRLAAAALPNGGRARFLNGNTLDCRRANLRREGNEITVENGVARISLSQGKHALVDEADLPLLEGRTWYAARSESGTYYARAHQRRGERAIHLHRLILDPEPNEEVDHINGDGLDNRRTNLRACPKHLNLANSPKYRSGQSKYKGIYRRKRRWAARVNVQGFEIHLGMAATEREAALLYDAGAREFFGEYARTNADLYPEDFR